MATYTSNTFGVTVTGAEGVTGPITPDGQVTIAYDGVNGFGATGPTLVLFDDNRNYTADAALGTNAVTGTWTRIGGGDQVARTGGRSGTLCAEMYNGSTDANDKSLVLFPSTTQGVFVSQAFKMPNSVWPGGIPTDTYHSGAFWKVNWIVANDATTGDWSEYIGNDNDVDLCMPANLNDTFVLFSNDNDANEMPTFYSISATSFHTFGQWARLSSWARRVDDVNDNLWMQGVGPAGYTEASTTERLFGSAMNQNYFQSAIFPGAVSHGGGNTTPQYDDIYIAIGDGCAARVEIGDNATYSSCTDLAIATVDSWSNTSITCTLREGGFADFSNKYIHIHDKDNNYVGSSRLIS